MKILFIGSEQQQMTGLILSLAKMQHETELYAKTMEEIEGKEEEEEALERFLKKAKPDFILSNVFCREAARASNRMEVKYAVWSMDSPSYPVWVPEADYDNCYVFYFDRREYELRKKMGRRNAYHMPLGVNAEWSEQLVITDEEIRKYACDMSFVGSMYTKNLYDRTVDGLSMPVRDAITDVIEQSAFLWDGQDRMHITDELLEMVRRDCPTIFDYPFEMPEEYFFKMSYAARKLTNVERMLLMELLSQQFDFRLYTWENEKVPEGVRRYPEVGASGDALKIFYASRINLNITLRSIVSGVPKRIFDIMSVGGFVLSNWQEEKPELFTEDKEIVTYKTPEELVDKAGYYLRHEKERLRIAVNGYRKVKECHTWEHRLEKIISVLFPRH